MSLRTTPPVAKTRGQHYLAYLDPSILTEWQGYHKERKILGFDTGKHFFKVPQFLGSDSIFMKAASA